MRYSPVAVLACANAGLVRAVQLAGNSGPSRNTSGLPWAELAELPGADPVGEQPPDSRYAYGPGPGAVQGQPYPASQPAYGPSSGAAQGQPYPASQYAYGPGPGAVQGPPYAASQSAYGPGAGAPYPAGQLQYGYNPDTGAAEGQEDPVSRPAGGKVFQISPAAAQEILLPFFYSTYNRTRPECIDEMPKYYTQFMDTFRVRSGVLFGYTIDRASGYQALAHVSMAWKQKAAVIENIAVDYRYNPFSNQYPIFDAGEGLLKTIMGRIKRWKVIVAKNYMYFCTDKARMDDKWFKPMFNSMFVAPPGGIDGDALGGIEGG